MGRAFSKKKLAAVKPLRESTIQNNVITYARKKKFICIKQGGAGAFGSAGWPDFAIWSPFGASFLIEFKATGKKPTPLQKKRIEALRAVGVRVEVVDNIKSGREVINEYV